MTSSIFFSCSSATNCCLFREIAISKGCVTLLLMEMWPCERRIIFQHKEKAADHHRGQWFCNKSLFFPALLAGPPWGRLCRGCLSENTRRFPISVSASAFLTLSFPTLGLPSQYLQCTSHCSFQVSPPLLSVSFRSPTLSLCLWLLSPHAREGADHHLWLNCRHCWIWVIWQCVTREFPA